jgi:hypothetical protein
LDRWDRRQLFLDGKRQTRARLPKPDPADPWRGGLVKVEAQAEKNSYTAFKYPERSFPRQWAKPAQALAQSLARARGEGDDGFRETHAAWWDACGQSGLSVPQRPGGLEPAHCLRLGAR